MPGHKVRITASIGEELAEKFTSLTRRIGVSGTALLSETLPHELDYLAEIETRSERREAAHRFFDKLFDTDSPHKLGRLNITLDYQVAERMTELCREKNIQRDQFINAYIYFLVNGEEDVCKAPLETVAEILRNPRYEFEEKRRNSPQEDQTLHNLNDDSFIINRPIPNPYSFLSTMGIGDDLLEGIERQMKKSGIERDMKKMRRSK
jgi:hypothetical protein